MIQNWETWLWVLRNKSAGCDGWKIPLFLLMYLFHWKKDSLCNKDYYTVRMDMIWFHKLGWRQFQLLLIKLETELWRKVVVWGDKAGTARSWRSRIFDTRSSKKFSHNLTLEYKKLHVIVLMILLLNRQYPLLMAAFIHFVKGAKERSTLWRPERCRRSKYSRSGSTSSVPPVAILLAA